MFGIIGQVNVLLTNTPILSTSDINKSIVSFCSKDSAHITGVNLIIDGEWASK
jgi:hypothetical protein